MTKDIRPRKLAREENKTKARSLRARGFSYPEIASMIGIAKSTVHSWFPNPDQPPKKKQSPLRVQNGKLQQELYEAKQEIKRLRKQLQGVKQNA